ncbi:hypothetical protein FBZ89_104400 [Nitrospirillum amazonense]|uniref:Uncharacterized protein n=1 Tax=Nitrospirillum amazonense TaxID=28077 RepID=A0A560FKM5_9PROT|nr:hypothetical protein [Nitrospirillum amazonense]TWB22150.1 hypothetical protein FBZ89_104400 [Nitrospirillum amazonense]
MNSRDNFDHLGDITASLIGELALRALDYHADQAADSSKSHDDRRRSLCEGFHCFYHAAKAGAFSP